MSSFLDSIPRPTTLDAALWSVLTTLVVSLFVMGGISRAHSVEIEALGRYHDLPVAHRFDFPVGGPDAEGYTLSQRFGENFHLGEDWNRQGSDEADRGDPVLVIARGKVTFAGHEGPVWGNVVRVVHHVRRHGRSAFVESLYAHLDRIDVRTGEAVDRGSPLGTIGDADGRYGPHLHLEIRRLPDLPLGPGYSSRNRAWLDPTAFILARRGPTGDSSEE